MHGLGKALFFAGSLLMIVGALLWSGVGGNWLGRLPRDINVSGEKFSFHFPIVTCLLVSVLLTIVFWLFRKF